jgi:hypothetical protein
MAADFQRSKPNRIEAEELFLQDRSPVSGQRSNSWNDQFWRRERLERKRELLLSDEEVIAGITFIPFVPILQATWTKQSRA